MVMLYEGLTRGIIGCAYTVHGRMGFGFLESVYEKCLMIELVRSGISAERQKEIDVYYGEDIVGEFIADMLVNDQVLLELKSVSHLTTAHEVQLVNYLAATEKEVGLLLNFGEEGVEVKRKVRRLVVDADCE